MNHIYKVIWNKVKNCYTVVSEIAKSHSTSSVTKKKVSIAAILVAGMLSGFSPMISGATDTTNSEAVVYDQNKTSLKSTNSNGVGKNAIALGKGAYAVANSIAIGNGAYTQDGNREKGQSVALGNGAVTGAKSTSIGNNAIGGREGTITIGANAKNEALYSTVVGTDSKITSDGTPYKFLGKKVIVQGAVSTSFGAHNTITNEKKVFSGVANSISGSANTVTNSNGVTIQGTGNTVSNAYKDMDIGLGDLWNFSDGDYSSLAKKDSGAIAIIGGGNTISNQTSSTVIGVANILKGENSTGVFTAGSHNTLTNVSNSLVMGDNNTLEGRKNVISLGNKNTVTADEAVAIGNGTTVSVESGVAIGVGSVADRVAESEKGARGEFAPDTIPTGQESTWTSTKGAVSVGDTANNITRQITNVAAGREDTDAVNVAQLKKVNEEAGKHSVVTEGANITVTPEQAEDGRMQYNVALNNNIRLSGDNDAFVSISGTNGTIETTGFIATKDKIYADKGAKLADVNVTGDTISNDKSSVKLDKEGTVTINNRVTIDQSGKISGVAAGEISSTSTDAVNGSQLKATNDRVSQVEGNITEIKGDITNIKSDITNIKGDVKNLGDRVTKVEQEAGKHTKVVNGSNVTVEETDQDGQKTYKVGLNKDLLLGDITGKNVSISGTNGTIETTGSIATKDKIYADKGAKLADIDITGDTISNGQSSVKLDKEGTVTINGKVSVNQDGKVSGVAAGDISEKSTDAVNGSQLFATNQQVAQNVQSISKLGNRINKVGAGAAALAALHPLDFDPDDKWDFAAGYGNYNGENAAAIGAYYRPNEDTMFSVGGSFGNGENMVNAGVSLKLGQGNHVSTSKVAMAKEIKDLRKEMEGLKSALLDANAGKKLDTSKLQLFPDVPKNHWAYEYVSTLKGNGMLTGYPDGEFKGDRPMTRYEFATMLYKAMLEGATLSDKILKEFAPELERFTVDTVHQDKDGKPTVERVRTVKAKK